ncbi:diguanylate cyclase [Vibrio metschnikovii]|nr:diguanylate cyclase [Vibrio metschnikovii]EKO3597892.1 diguanylate cyclase [Vibrio metschnikovii]EKO3709756.1 diguanylate cyclase [Vibrio metschnikovii]EKO3730369.1 diguanylate cyclase [Vibrio metschnikovii]
MGFDFTQIDWLDSVITPLVVIDDQLAAHYINEAAERIATSEIRTPAVCIVSLFQLEKRGCDIHQLLSRLILNLTIKQTTVINDCFINDGHERCQLTMTKLSEQPSRFALLQISTQNALSGNVFSFFINSPIAIMLTDCNDIIQSINPAFEDLLGYTQSELLGLKPDFLRLGLHEESTLNEIWQVLDKGNQWRGEIHHRKKDGSVVTNILSIIKNENNIGGFHYISFLTDISSHFDEIRKLKKRAYYDYLTTLPNRYLLEQEINVLIKNKTEFYLNFIDLGKFKEINDTHGHETGDKLLFEIGRRLSKLDDIFVCRYGGDEFITISRQESKVDDINQLLTIPFSIKKEEIVIGIHIGTAQYPNDSQEIEELIVMADKNMYQEKNSEK